MVSSVAKGHYLRHRRWKFLSRRTWRIRHGPHYPAPVDVLVNGEGEKDSIPRVCMSKYRFQNTGARELFKPETRCCQTEQKVRVTSNLDARVTIIQCGSKDSVVEMMSQEYLRKKCREMRKIKIKKIIGRRWAKHETRRLTKKERNSTATVVGRSTRERKSAVTSSERCLSFCGQKKRSRCKIIISNRF